MVHHGAATSVWRNPRHIPHCAGTEPTLAGGFWNDDDKLDQTHVSIRIEAAGPRGELRLLVALATPDGNFGKSTQHGVQVGIILSYSDLGAFQRDFAALLDGKLRTACLEAAPT